MQEKRVSSLCQPMVLWDFCLTILGKKRIIFIEAKWDEIRK